MKNNRPSHPVYDILSCLDRIKASYSIARNRSDAIDIYVTTVGMRIEISVFEDGHIEYSVFEGNEDVSSGRDELFSLLNAVST